MTDFSAHQSYDSDAFRTMIRRSAEADQQSVTALVQELVRIPTRGGIDDYEEIVNLVSDWLGDHDLFRYRLMDRYNRAIGLVCDVNGQHSGPRYVLNACLDTAPFGDPTTWRYAPPNSGTIEGGWLYGRGAADSKAAIAIFMHIALRLRDDVTNLHGSLSLLFDADEHTGNFGGAKQYFGDGDKVRDVRGVMIGYPGIDELVIGGRGFRRATITVRGESGHTGSRRTTEHINAVQKAAELVRIFAKYQAPGPVDPVLQLPPKLTVTGIAGGESYSIIPDYCTVKLDVRLTSDFDQVAADKLIQDAIISVDNQWSAEDKPTTVEFIESWPAYQLAQDSPVRVALMRAAGHHLRNGVTAKVAGPSNIGNYLAKLGIDATAGLGVNYQGLHATDERIELSTIPLIQAVYHEAIMTLLSPGSPTLS